MLGSDRPEPPGSACEVLLSFAAFVSRRVPGRGAYDCYQQCSFRTLRHLTWYRRQCVEPLRKEAWECLGRHVDFDSLGWECGGDVGAGLASATVATPPCAQTKTHMHSARTLALSGTPHANGASAAHEWAH